jgi:hypothetical protein
MVLSASAVELRANNSFVRGAAGIGFDGSKLESAWEAIDVRLQALEHEAFQARLLSVCWFVQIIEPLSWL